MDKSGERSVIQCQTLPTQELTQVTEAKPENPPAIATDKGEVGELLPCSLTSICLVHSYVEKYIAEPIVSLTKEWSVSLQGARALCFDELTNMDSESSIESEKAA